MAALRNRLLCEQLGRWWSENTAIAGGLAFVESSDSTPGALYAAPLPRRAHRLEAAASITLVSAPAALRQERSENIAVRIEAHAPTRDASMNLISDLRELLWPSGGQFVRIGTLHDGAAVPGLIGFLNEPPTVDAFHWRIVTAEMLVGPVHGPGRSSEGQAVASMEILFAAIPYLVPGFPVAFSVHRDVGTPTVEVTATELKLRVTAQNVQIYPWVTYPMIGDLFTAVDANAFWVTSDHDVAHDARASSDLFEFAPVSALGEANKVPLRLPDAA